MVFLFTTTVVPGVSGVIVFAMDKGLAVVGLTVKVRAFVTAIGVVAAVDGVTFAGVITSTGVVFVDVIATESIFVVVDGLMVVPLTAVLPFFASFPTIVLVPIAPAAIVPMANVPVAVFVPKVPGAVFTTVAPISELLSMPGTTGSLSLVLCFDTESLSLLFFLLGFFMFLITFPVDFTGARLLFIGMVTIPGFANTFVTFCVAMVDVS